MMTQEMKALLGIGLLTVLILVGGVFFLSKSSPATVDDAGNTKRADGKLLVKEDSYFAGNKKAKVTIVEFADFQCPACSSAQPIVKRIIEDYKDKIFFVFRHFPLPQHKNAKLAGLVGEAAGAQGKFWQMYDMLYENQSEWGESSKPMDFFTKYAQDLGLNVDKLKEDIKKDALANKMQRDLDDGNAVGVNSTPTFYVNGLQLRGVPQYSELQKLIESELKK